MRNSRCFVCTSQSISWFLSLSNQVKLGTWMPCGNGLACDVEPMMKMLVVSLASELKWVYETVWGNSGRGLQEHPGDKSTGKEHKKHEWRPATRRYAERAWVFYLVPCLPPATRMAQAREAPHRVNRSVARRHAGESASRALVERPRGGADREGAGEGQADGAQPEIQSRRRANILPSRCAGCGARLRGPRHEINAELMVIASPFLIGICARRDHGPGKPRCRRVGPLLEMGQHMNGPP